jgi:hypothetical protein
VLVKRLRPLLQSDLAGSFPKRVVRIVSDDSSLVQQLWFALYPRGWDIDVDGGLSVVMPNLLPMSSVNGSQESVSLTIMDGLTTAAQSGAETNSFMGATIWVDSPDGNLESLRRPLDLAGVLEKVAMVQEDLETDKMTRVLLADPYQLFRQALRECLDDQEDIQVVAAVASAGEFRAARQHYRYDVAVVASDLLVGTFATGPLKPGDVLLAQSEAIAERPGQPPTIILVSDDDLRDPRVAARMWQPGESIATSAYIFRGAPAEVVAEAIRNLAAGAESPGG